MVRASERLRVGIIGGGASGTIVAARLLRQSDRPVEVVVYEPRDRLGEGVAYSTTDPHHLLNVPACGMSALVEDPDHFRRWAGIAPTDFAPRRDYARYLRALLSESVDLAPAGSELSVVRELVTNVGLTPTPWIVTGNGSYSSFDRVVIATGNDAPAVPEAIASARLPQGRVVTDPWAPDALADVQPGECVLLVGTGLTGVDVAMTLATTVRGVRMVALSRHGLVPAAHEDPWQPRHDVPEWDPSEITPRDLARYVRSFGADWRRGLDSLRPITPALWQAFDDRTREQVVRHGARFWDVHRHRMAPQVARVFDRLVRAGRVRLHTAGLQSAIATAAGVDVLLSCGETLRVDRIVVCTGPTGLASRDPLARLLVARGQATPGPLGIGYDIDPVTGALRDGDGAPYETVSTVGPPRRGALWEATAIPEIRQHADDVAHAILDRQSVAA